MADAVCENCGQPNGGVRGKLCDDCHGKAYDDECPDCGDYSPRNVVCDNCKFKDKHDY